MRERGDLVRAVREHARENSASKGWLYIAEMWADGVIANEIAGCRSPEAAIEKVRIFANGYEEAYGE